MAFSELLPIETTDESVEAVELKSEIRYKLNQLGFVDISNQPWKQT